MENTFLAKIKRLWAGLKPRTRKIIIGVVVLFMIVGILGEEEETTKAPAETSQHPVALENPFEKYDYHKKEMLTQADVDTIKAQIPEVKKDYNSTLDEVKKYNEKYPFFQISGDVQDKTKNRVQIWGTAFQVRSPGSVNHWAARTDNTNIVVTDPDPESTGNYYNGHHYFIESSKGKNAMGNNVPVFVYGSIKKSEQKKMDVLNNRMEALRQEIDYLEGQTNSTLIIDHKIAVLDIDATAKIIAEKIFNNVHGNLSIGKVVIRLTVSADALNEKEQSSYRSYTGDQYGGQINFDRSSGIIPAILNADSLKSYLRDDSNIQPYRDYLKKSKSYKYLKKKRVN